MGQQLDRRTMTVHRVDTDRTAVRVFGRTTYTVHARDAFGGEVVFEAPSRLVARQLIDRQVVVTIEVPD